MNRTLIWQLAFRYFRGKGTANIVPILSRISMVAIAICCAAMVIVFSVFNGFDGLVKDLYKVFYPQVKISAAKGKFIPLTDAQRTAIYSITGVQTLDEVIEDKVLVSTGDEQRVAILKGVGGDQQLLKELSPYYMEGDKNVNINVAGDNGRAGEPLYSAIIGQQLLNELGGSVYNALSELVLYYPNASAKGFSLTPDNAFQYAKLAPMVSFQVQEEFDTRYIVTSIDVAQKLMQANGRFTSIELKLDDAADEDRVIAQVQQLLGDQYKVESRYEQNKTLYMVMSGEKWASYLILLLVLLIAAFNMIGALTLLVLEKQKDMAILMTMGTRPATVKGIFLTEGILWSLAGGITGLTIGLILSWLQQKYEFVKLQGSFIIEAYPVAIKFSDVVVIFVTIIFIGLFASWLPAMRAGKIEAISLKSS